MKIRKIIMNFIPINKQTKTIFKDKDQIKLNYEKYVDEELDFKN